MHPYIHQSLIIAAWVGGAILILLLIYLFVIFIQFLREIHASQTILDRRMFLIEQRQKIQLESAKKMLGLSTTLYNQLEEQQERLDRMDSMGGHSEGITEDEDDDESDEFGESEHE